MADKYKYMPVLKAKAGEYKALKSLSGQIKSEILPLIEVVDVPWDYEDDEPATTVDIHLRKIVQNLLESWGTENKVLLDFTDTLQGETVADGGNAVEFVLNLARELGLKAVPVTSVDRSREYQKAVNRANKLDRYGIAIRVEGSEFESSEINDLIIDLMSTLEITPQQADFILDFKYIQPDTDKFAYLAYKHASTCINNINDWRGFYLVSTSFPKDLSEFSAGKASYVPRSEWHLWQNIFKNQSEFTRVPVYGDYTISYPEMIEIDPRILTMSASLRYTVANDFLILKGSSIKKMGSGQYPAKCRQLVGMVEFSGNDFSAGDKHINDCANGNVGNGNATTWRWVGVNHHITFVTQQLSTHVV
jgi:hypothetical protein